ncbi:MAG: HK97 gp10 family phage protein [Alicyclobacillus sp.]|nr:HK97 gp10 family phage protein [Alicyclobacillus sp.]
MGASMRVTGMDELMARLREMGADVNKVQNKALRAGAKPIAEAIAANVNVSDRNEVHIRDDIVIGRPKEDAGRRYIEIGPSKKTAWRAKFLEFGHAVVKNGRIVGHAPPYPFMKPGLEQSKDKALAEAKRVIKEALRL